MTQFIARLIAFALLLGLFVSPSSAQSTPPAQFGDRFNQPIRTNQTANQKRHEFTTAAANNFSGRKRDPAGQTSPALRENRPAAPLGSSVQRQFEKNKGVSQSTRQMPNQLVPARPKVPQISNASYRNPQQQQQQQPDAFSQFGGGTPANSYGQSSQEGYLNQSMGQVAQDGYVNLGSCSVQFIDDIDLPAQEPGQIQTLSVKEGDSVSGGKIIGRIDDNVYRNLLRQAELKYAIAKQKSSDNTSIMAAENEINLARVEYQRVRSLASKGSKSESERERARFSYQLAMLKKVAAQNEKKSAYGEMKIQESEMTIVQSRMDRHMLRSDFDGFVVELYRHPQEWVNAGEPVMRIVRMDRLWVQGIVNSNLADPHELMNRPVTIKLQMARNQQKEFTGTIVHVGLERESNTSYMVKAEIKNEPIGGHWVLQPGSSVSMSIKLDKSTAAKPTIGNKPIPTKR